MSLAIDCQQITKKFGNVHAVRGVNLSLSPGQFMALLGPSGCGKTTTLRMLAGFERPDSGTITIAGDLVDGPRQHVPPERRSVGMVFQEYALFPHLTVFQNVAYGLARGVNKKRRVAEMLALVGLADVERRMPFELSGGQQQRVALARALAPHPQLILLDEPFSNLDAGLRGQVRAEVRQILRQVNATAIFVTHDQDEALSLADQVAVMMHGEVVQCDSPQRLYRIPATHEAATFLGEANFLPGTASGNSVTCELGQLGLIAPANGSVEVMIRPEALWVSRQPDGQAEVIGLDYFGHTQLVQVRLPSGAILKSRLLGSVGDFVVQQRVSVSVRGDVVVY